MAIGLGIGGLVVAVGLYVWLQVVAPLGNLHSNDFKHLYLGSVQLARGVSPYDTDAMREAAFLNGWSLNPYVYLPFTAQALRPVCAFGFDGAATAWFTLNHLFFLGAIGLLAWRRGWGVAASMVACGAVWYPLSRTLTAGQLNCALLFLLTLLWWADRRGWPALAGFALAFATLLKIAPAFLFLSLLLTRRWRLLAWSGGWLGVLLVGSVLWCGPDRYLEFLPTLQDMGYGKSTWSDVGNEFYRDPMNNSINAFAHRAFTEIPERKPLANLGASAANAMTWVVSLGLLAAGCVFWFLQGKRRESDDDRTLAVGVLLMLLLPSLYWDHYGVLVILPVAILARSAQGGVLGVFLKTGAALGLVRFGQFLTFKFADEPSGVLFSSGLWLALLGASIVGVVTLFALRQTQWARSVALVSGCLLIGLQQGFFHHLEGSGVLLFSMALWGTLLVLAVSFGGDEREAQGESG